MMTENSICLGNICSAHGLHGHVKIKTLTEKPQDFGAYGDLYNGDQIFHIQNIRVTSPDSVIVLFSHIKNRTEAETLKGLALYIKRDQLPPCEGDECYHHDLIGLVVMDDTQHVYGTVSGVLDYGAGTFLDIKTPDNTVVTCPFSQDAVVRIVHNDDAPYIMVRSECVLI